MSLYGSEYLKIPYKNISICPDRPPDVVAAAIMP